MSDQMLVGAYGEMFWILGDIDGWFSYEDCSKHLGGGPLEYAAIKSKPGWVIIGRDAAWMEGYEVNPWAKELTGEDWRGPVLVLHRGNLAWLNKSKRSWTAKQAAKTASRRTTSARVTGR